MKFTLTNLSLICLTTIVLFSACEKDNDGSPETPKVFPTDCFLEETTRVEDGTESRNTYQRDDNGAMTESAFFDDGDLLSRSVLQRNNTGRIDRIDYFDESGEMTWYRDYQYGNSGALPSGYSDLRIEGDGSESLIFRVEYEYEGTKILSTRFFSVNSSGEESLSSSTIYEYEEDASQIVVTTETFDEDDVLLRSGIRTYDKETPNPFLSGAPFTYYYSSYALTKVEAFDESGQPNEDATYEVVYDLDEVEQSINIQELYLNGNTTVYDLSFNCD